MFTLDYTVEHCDHVIKLSFNTKTQFSLEIDLDIIFWLNVDFVFYYLIINSHVLSAAARQSKKLTHAIHSWVFCQKTGKVFGKAFRILGLVETDCRWIVKQDFRGNSCIIVTCFFGLFSGVLD